MNSLSIFITNVSNFIADFPYKRQAT